MSGRLISLLQVALLAFGLAQGCANAPEDQRSKGGSLASVKIGLGDFSKSPGLRLTGGSSEGFSILIQCADAYSTTVTTSEFTLPVNARNCIGKLQEFTQNGKVFRPTSNGFSTYQPPEMATFSDGTTNLFVYVLAQLPATLNTFAEIRYKWSDNRQDLAIGVESAEVNFSRVVVGDQPEPLNLVRAFSPRPDEVSLVFECQQNIIGSSVSDGICIGSAIRNLRVAALPYPSVPITQGYLESQVESLGQTLGLMPDALLIYAGQWFTSRGGVTTTLSLPQVGTDQDYLVVLTSVGSNSFAYARLSQADDPNPAIFSVGGTISGLADGATIGISVNGGSGGGLSLTGNMENFGNGNFQLGQLMRDRDAFNLTMESPDGHTCGSANMEGSISGENWTDVVISCSHTDSGSQDPPAGGSSQGGTANDFISTWKTDNPGTSSDTQITLPLHLSGSYNFTVNWGDGTSDTITSHTDAAVTHTYATPGTYTVTISGDISGWRFDNGGDRQKITNISQWGSLKLGRDRGSYFRGASNLTLTATDALDLSITTSLKKAFQDCTSLTTAPSMALWDTSGVTNMERVFQSATSFNENIGSWDTSKVTTMSGMFFNATSFNGDISSWDTSNVQHMAEMFALASAFNQDIGSWNTSSVGNFTYIFYLATSFDQDIGSWDLSGASISYMGAFFSGVTLSPANYDALLVGWESSGLHQNSIEFDGGNSKYTAVGAEARSKLFNDHGWRFNDGGQL